MRLRSHDVLSFTLIWVTDRGQNWAEHLLTFRVFEKGLLKGLNQVVFRVKSFHSGWWVTWNQLLTLPRVVLGLTWWLGPTRISPCVLFSRLSRDKREQHEKEYFVGCVSKLALKTPDSFVSVASAVTQRLSSLRRNWDENKQTLTFFFFTALRAWCRWSFYT